MQTKSKKTIPTPLILTRDALLEQSGINADNSWLIPKIQLENTSIKQDSQKIMLNDLKLAVYHLMQYSKSPATFNFYRTEVNRFLNWAWHIAGMSILELKRSNIVDYIDFCIFPEDEWVSDQTDYAFIIGAQGNLIQNSKWRPFQSSEQNAAAQSTIETVFSRLSTFYHTLLLDAHVSHNPVKSIRQKNNYKRKRKSMKTFKVMSPEQIEACIEVCDIRSDNAETSREFIRAERDRFAIILGVGLYIRVSEMVKTHTHSPTHGDFFRDSDGFWWFKTVGKGNKERIIVVPDYVLDAFKRYRVVHDLSEFPLPNEKTPLFISIGNGAWDNQKDCFARRIPLTDTLIMWKNFKRIFADARAHMMNNGRGEDALELISASCHWLRHTGISNDVKNRPIDHVKEDAGHESSQTTWSYVNSINKERALSKKTRYS